MSKNVFVTTTSIICVIATVLLGVITIVGCSGGGGDGGGDGGGGSNKPGSAPTLSLGSDIKTLKFTWTPVSGSTYYQLYENPDGASGYTPIGGQLLATSYSLTIAVHRYNWAQASYVVEACNSTGCGPASNTVNTVNAMLAAIGYFKASNTGAGDWFGVSVALSADGSTLAVGAVYEDSGATGIDGNQSSNATSNSGAVYVFTHASGTWSQQAYIKASNSGAGDYFGRYLSLSTDGNTLAVGAWGEGSNATGINGNQGNNTAPESGAVYVFTRSNSTWSQQTYIKASNTGAGDWFGAVLALSGD